MASTISVCLCIICCSIATSYQSTYDLLGSLDDMKTRIDTMNDAGNETPTKSVPIFTKKKVLAKNNTKEKITTEKSDNHKYYKRRYILHGDQYFHDLRDINKTLNMTVIKHQKLSNTYKKAFRMGLKFLFPFYGNLVNSVVVTTGGFINIGPKFHSFVHIIHYIAPLMANFNPMLSEESAVYICSGTTSFKVQWTNMVLNGSKNLNETFTFQITLHKNGTVLIAYKAISIPPLNIANITHNVTGGFSDGFIMSYLRHDQDKIIIHNYIYLYHKVNFLLSSIKSGSAYILDLLPTCIQFKDCFSCLDASEYTKFTCRWCPALKQCSDSLDWNRQTWLENKCDHNSYSNSKQCPSKKFPIFWKKSKSSSKKTTSHIIGAVVGMALLILILAGAGMFYYAYTHPQTKSGMWLIEHRPQRIFHSNFNKIPEEEML